MQLLDIAPVKKDVSLSSGKSVSVSGVNARGIISIFARFPEVRMLMTGKTVTIDKWIELAPDAIVAAIACALGGVGDKTLEAQVDQLPLEDQLALLTAAWEATLPNGVGPFVASLERMGLFSLAESGKAPATISPKPSKP